MTEQEVFDFLDSFAITVGNDREFSLSKVYFGKLIASATIKHGNVFAEKLADCFSVNDDWMLFEPKTLEEVAERLVINDSKLGGKI
jgi:hypothetical protein